MANSRELILRLVSDVSQFGRGFARAEREASNFSKNVARAFGATGKDIDTRARAIDASLKTAVGGFTAFAAGATGAVLAVRQLADFGGDAIDAFSDLQESANAVNVVFGDSARIVEDFGETAATSVGLARSEFLELAARVGGQLQNLGLSTQEAADQTLALTQRAADLASVYGGSVADALGAISAALRGERDPIERYAITLNDANVSARALADGLATTKAELDATDKAAASIALIFEQSDKVAGDFANTADDVANKQRVLAAEFENAKAVIGEALLPAYQAGIDLIPVFIEALENLAPAIERVSSAAAENGDEVASFIERLPALAGATGDFVGAFADAATGITALGAAAGNTAMSIADTLTFRQADGARNYAEAVDDGRAAWEAFGRVADSINFGKLNRAIASGVTPVNAYATVIRDVARNGEVAQSVIDDLATVAGLSNAQQRDALFFLLDNADALRLSTAGAESLAGAYTDLLYAQQQLTRDASRGQLNPDNEAEKLIGNSINFALGQLSSDTDRGLTELDESLRSRLAEAADTAQAGVESLVSRISETRAEFASEIDLFNQIEIDTEAFQTPGEILGNLEQQADVLGRFGDALGTLASEGLTSLVGELLAAGPSAVGEAEALAGDIESAFAIEEQLKTNMELATDAAFATLSPSENQDKANEAFSLGQFIGANVNDGFNDAINFGPGLSSALSRRGSGTSSVGSAAQFQARATGGPVQAGVPYIVGENQPELFVPDVSGRILPDLSGLGGSTTFNFNPTVVGSGNVGRDLDTQRHLLLASVGRMVEGM